MSTSIGVVARSSKVEIISNFGQSLLTSVKTASLKDQITGSMIAVGFTTTVLSMFDICHSACTDAALYTMFGMPFAWTGIVFFILIGSLFAFKGKPHTSNILDLMAFCAAGAEVFFLLVQKYGIGHFCPSCLVIASSVIILASTRLWLRLRSDTSKRLSISAMVALLCLLMGFVVSAVGIDVPQKITEAQAIALAQGTASLSTEDIWFGNAASDVEIYFISDWYCPFCRNSEKDVEKVLPALGKVAKYTFLDLTAHKQSRVLSPYGLSLLLGNKSSYLDGRRALLAVSDNKYVPTDAEILASLKTHGVDYRSADPNRARALDSMSAVFFLHHNIRSTPSVVVVNKATKQQQIVNVEQFKVEEILSAIAAVK